MKIELYKAYKTRGGWKAVVVDEILNGWLLKKSSNATTRPLCGQNQTN